MDGPFPLQPQYIRRCLLQLQARARKNIFYPQKMRGPLSETTTWKNTGCRKLYNAFSPTNNVTRCVFLRIKSVSYDGGSGRPGPLHFLRAESDSLARGRPTGAGDGADWRGKNQNLTCSHGRRHRRAENVSLPSSELHNRREDFSVK